MPHVIHSILLPIKTQKATFLRDACEDATNQEASTVTTMAGHCNASITFNPNAVTMQWLYKRAHPSAP